jgi:hypothetical protein
MVPNPKIFKTTKKEDGTEIEEVSEFNERNYTKNNSLLKKTYTSHY